MQQMRQREHIRHVRRRSQDGMDDLVTAVDAHVRLHAEVPLFALGDLMHIGIPLAPCVLRRARRADNGGIDDRTVAELDAVARQVPINRGEQFLAELVALEQLAELAHRGFIWCCFLSEVDADKPAHRYRLVERFLHRRIRRLTQSCRK